MRYDVMSILVLELTIEVVQSQGNVYVEDLSKCRGQSFVLIT